MTGDVTFVTEQTEEVLYVSHRAIITEDDKTYVKVKTADGSIVKKEIRQDCQMTLMWRSPEILQKEISY